MEIYPVLGNTLKGRVPHIKAAAFEVNPFVADAVEEVIVGENIADGKGIAAGTFCNNTLDNASKSIVVVGC